MRKLNTWKTSFFHKELTVRFTRQVKKGLDGIELEGQSNGEMKWKITAKVWMDGIMLLLGSLRRIDGLHAHVKTQYEITKVEA